MTNLCFVTQSRSQRPRSFWSATGIGTRFFQRMTKGTPGHEVVRHAEVEKVHGSDSASFSANKEDIISAIFQRATGFSLKPTTQ